MNGDILIIGATSGIACALAAEFARRGHGLVLAGRDRHELEAVAADLGLRWGASVAVRRFEALDYGAHPELFAGLDLAGAVVCHGYLGDQGQAECDFAEAHAIIDLNYTSYVSVLLEAACYFENRGRGFICALASVAGDRGRRSNYLYGSAKGGLALFMQGLRARLHRSGIRVITVKPGFVDTGMTFGLLREGPLVASPEQVARGICQTVAAGRDVVYLPGFWRWIMLVVRSVPETLFKRLSL